VVGVPPSCPPPSLSKTVLKSQESDPRFQAGEGRDEEGFLRSCCPIRSDLFFSFRGTVPGKVTQLREQCRYSGASRKGVVSLPRHQISAAVHRMAPPGYDDGGHSAGIRSPVPCCWTVVHRSSRVRGADASDGPDPIELGLGRWVWPVAGPVRAAYDDSIHSLGTRAQCPGLVAHASPSVSVTGYRVSFTVHPPSLVTSHHTTPPVHSPRHQGPGGGSAARRRPAAALRRCGRRCRFGC